MNSFSILKRLYKDYTKKFRHKIILSVFYTVIVAGSTSAIAWLLDPAIKKLFVDKNQALIIIIPSLIVLSFALKGTFLYLARTTMIGVAENAKALIPFSLHALTIASLSFNAAAIMIGFPSFFKLSIQSLLTATFIIKFFLFY